MSVLSKTGSGRGGARVGAGAKPSTLEGLLKRSSPRRAEILRRDIRRTALELLMDWGRAELRRLPKSRRLPKRRT
jgi:hypothetical protein